VRGSLAIGVHLFDVTRHRLSSSFRQAAIAVAALILALVVGGCTGGEGRTARVVDGVFEAREARVGEDPVPLVGAWRVRWPRDPAFDGLMPVPSRIHEQRHPPTWDAGEGLVDFDVELRNLPRDEPLALYVGRLFPTSTRCVGDDGSSVVAGRNGFDATHPSSQLAPYVVALPSARVVRCTVHLYVSEARRGGRPGLWVAPQIGTSRAVYRTFDRERVRDSAFTAMLLTLSGFFFQWLLRRDEMLAFHVALFNAAAAAWHTGFAHLLDSEPLLGPIVRARIEYAAIPLTAYFGLGTALRIRPSAFARLERALAALAVAASLALLVVPALHLHALLHAVQPFVLATALAVLLLALRALFSPGKGPETRLAALGLLFPAICGAADVVTAILTLGIGSTLGVGMFFLAVALALVLAQRNARARLASERYSEATSRFVPKEFLHALGDADVTDARLGQATDRDMTILFADIRGFTSISEALTPEETFRFLNDCFACVGPPIREYGGFIDKYIGDAIMALFQRSPAEAVRAAVAMQEALREANAAGAFRAPVELGIGIHVGHVMMGTLGEAQRFEATVISEAVEAALGGRAEDAAARFDELASIVPEDGPVQWWRVQAAAELSESASTVRGGALHTRAKV
jgi:class 3 adenylate cyclase